MSAIYPLQVAIVGRLKADSAVAAIVGARKCYDTSAPAGTALPYVTLDSPTGVEESGTLEHSEASGTRSTCTRSLTMRRVTRRFPRSRQQ
jgi:hypothetical protein